MNDRLLLASLIALFCAACGDDTGGSGGSGSGGDDDSSGPGGTDCPTLSDGPGGEACGDETCDPGSYCDSVSLCQIGCETSNTCAEGEWCDLAGAGPGEAGTCRPAPSDCTDDPTTTGGGSGTPADCDERCVAKLLDCGFEEQVESPQATCNQACEVLTVETLECLEAASCGALADGEECGVPFGD